VSSVDFAPVLEQLLAHEDLSAALTERAFGAILDGSWSEAQIAAFAVALRAKGESPSEIAAAARALRARAFAIHPQLPAGTPLLDTCGTGGDGASTLNVSTITALVVAASGVAVAKHGNRAVSSRAGSADLLEALGVRIVDESPAVAGRLTAAIEQVGIAFLFAPRHHSALRHAAKVRRELGVRTIFNLLGPLANPAGATHQLLGVFDDRRRPTLAAVLAELGTVRAWVVHGEPTEGAPRGLDEVSPSGPTRVTELDRGTLRELVIVPADAGLAPTPLSALAGGDATDNARATEAILAGEPHPARSAVLLNAACALVVAGVEHDLVTARQRAERALDDGRARDTLARLRRAMEAP